MSKYHIAEAAGFWFVIRDSDSNPHSKHEYFTGYDFMGSANWAPLFSFDYALSGREEAEQIAKDLGASEDVPMCTVVYGESRNIKHTVIMPVENAFRGLKQLKHGWAFLNIYYNKRLVYTTQGAAGYRFRCTDCPYPKTKKTVTPEQYSMIYGG